MTRTNGLSLGRLMVMAGDGDEAAKQEIEARRRQNATWYQANKTELFRKAEK